MSHLESQYDVIILGGGGAGMMCGIQAGIRGRRVLVLDHAKKVGGKILISGGGRCNFTNLGASPQNYVSQNPHFCKSALSRFVPADFIELVKKHKIRFHEKKLGQLFCDQTAQDIVTLLKTECEDAGVTFLLDCQIKSVTRCDAPEGESSPYFKVTTSRGVFRAPRLVVATGGLSIPKLGATGLGYELARQFGHTVVETAPALDGFTLPANGPDSFQGLAGVAVDCVITCQSKQLRGKGDGRSPQISFRENILFTHAGLSGPAALQASLHWHPGDSIWINFLPEKDISQWFIQLKKSGSRTLLKNHLAELIPSRLAHHLCELVRIGEQPLVQVKEPELLAFSERLQRWEMRPSGTVGYTKAEVTRGGVNTDELSSKTMESKKVSGLYFIGEVVDVTGWLGGYNYQWAWASGWAAGQDV